MLVFFLPPTILVMRLCDRDRGSHNNACTGANKNTKINRIDEISKKSGMIPLEIVFKYQNIVLCWQRGFFALFFHKIIIITSKKVKVVYNNIIDIDIELFANKELRNLT